MVVALPLALPLSDSLGPSRQTAFDPDHGQCRSGSSAVPAVALLSRSLARSDNNNESDCVCLAFNFAIRDTLFIFLPVNYLIYLVEFNNEYLGVAPTRLWMLMGF